MQDIEEAKAAAERVYQTEKDKMFGTGPKDCTVHDALNDYYDRSKKLKQSKKTQVTWRKYRDEMTEFWGANKYLSALVLKDINNYIGSVTEKGLGSASVNRRMAYLSASIEYARKNKHFHGDNPANDTEKPKENVREKWFTPEEMGKVLREAYEISAEGRRECLRIRQRTPEIQNKTHQAFYLYIRILASTGGRAGEVLALRWGDIKTNHVTFRAVTTKGKKVRVATVPPEIVEEIATYKSDEAGPEDYVIDIDCRDASQFGRHWRKLRKRLGLGSDYYVHTLRHSYATNLINAGYDLQTVQLIMGHSSVSVTSTYTHRTGLVDMSVLRTIAPAIAG